MVRGNLCSNIQLRYVPTGQQARPFTCPTKTIEVEVLLVAGEVALALRHAETTGTYFPAISAASSIHCANFAGVVYL